MIQNLDDLKKYLHEDSRNYQHVIGFKRWWNQTRVSPISDQWYIWKYIRTMRYCELHINSKGFYHKVLAKMWLHRLRKLSSITGFQIPPNTIGSGLTIWHWGPIIINPAVTIGKNCTLNPMVIIGHKMPKEPAPHIGDDVFVGGGAKIIGDINIGNNVSIAPNAVVVKDVPDNAVVGGVPCKILKYKYNK